MIIIGFVSIIRSIVAKCSHQTLHFTYVFHFLSAIMYFQNVGLFTIEKTELIPHKF